MPHSLRTERLVLRPPLPRDARPLEASINDPAVTAETETWAYPSDADVIRRRLAFMAAFPPKELSFFLIVLGARPIGTIGLAQRQSRTYGLGYMIGRRFWGRGYTSEAVRAVCRHGFRTLGAAVIEADVFTENVGSRRVLEKTGFRALGDVGPGWSATRQANFPRLGFELVREGWSS